MMVGSEKLLLSLGVSAIKTGVESLKHTDVCVLDMSVKSSWNSESIGEVLDKIKTKTGRTPSYVVSDNASTISKALRDKEYIPLCDIGHSMGLIIQRVYEKDEKFQSFTKEVSAVKFREIMRPSAYLLPPKQRTIARFMNLSHTVDWAVKMLNAFERLTSEEQKIFQFLHNHTEIINELKMIHAVINPLMKILKDEGLSHANVERCMEKVTCLQSCKVTRISAVGQGIELYLRQHQNKLPNKDTVWNISSDIIESMFGSYKFRKSPNAMNGVTKRVFILPLLTRMGSEITDEPNIDFKKCLEAVFMKNLITWQKDNLTENMTTKRINTLCN